MLFIERESHRRDCDLTSVVVDAIRLSAAAGQIKEQQQQISQIVSLLSDIFSHTTSRFNDLEKAVMQTVFSAGALAKQAGAFEQAQAGFSEWKLKKENVNGR